MSLISKELLSSDLANIEDVLSEQEQKTLQLCLQHSVGRRAVSIAMDGIRRIISRQSALAFCRNGYWVQNKSISNGNYFECSECNTGISLDENWNKAYKHVFEIHRFCHMCGAYMIGEKE